MDLGQIQIIVKDMTASGKSTVVDLLAERLGFKVMPEEFRDQHDLLSRFHHDRRWAFPMQLNFLVTRFAQYLCASEENDYIMDRSIFGDKVYATLYYKQHYFTDSQFGCYLTLYDSLLRNTASPRLLILVRCPFEEILRRIRARGRQDEIDAGVEYWRLLFDAYQPFLEFVRKEMQIPNVLELDLADPAFIKTPERVERFLDDVRAFFPERFAGLQ